MRTLIKAREAAEMLGIHRQTLINWIKNKTLDSIVKHRVIYVFSDQLDKLTSDLVDTEESRVKLQQEKEAYTQELEMYKQARKDFKEQFQIEKYGRFSNKLFITSKYYEFLNRMFVEYEILSAREADILNDVLKANTVREVADSHRTSTTNINLILQKALSKISQVDDILEKIKHIRDIESENGFLKCVLKNKNDEITRLNDTITLLEEDLEIKRELEEKINRQEDCTEDFIAAVPTLGTKLEDLNLTRRTLNCCRAADIDTIGDLVQKSKTDLLKLRNFGKKSLSELDDLIESLGLHFDMDLDSIFESKYKTFLLKKY